MKRFLGCFSILLITSEFFFSCAPVYVPTTHNAPLFSGKGEFQGSVTAFPGVNAQAAYAVSNHFGLTANYLFVRSNGPEKGREHQAGEIGLGYYTHFNDEWSFELFAGYGLGKGSAYDSTYEGFSLFSMDQYEASGKYEKFFVQPTIGLRKGKFTWGFSTKFSHVDFSKVGLSLNDNDLNVDGKTKTFVSAVTTGRMPMFGGKIYFQYQGGFNVPLGKEPTYDFDTMILSCGFMFIPKSAR